MKAPLQREAAVEHALTIEGWMTKEELETLFDWASEMDSIVEVGSWKGRSTYVLCQACKGTVTAVDTFKGSANDAGHKRLVEMAGGSTYPEFRANTAGCNNLTVVQGDSLTAAKCHPPVDMVFIDGGHSEAEAVADLTAWLPKARKLICGHDFQFETVRAAVRGVLGTVEISKDTGTLWWKHLPLPGRVPLFSILHTSARPEKCMEVYHDWMSKAKHPEDVEYVLCIDPRWGFDVEDMSKYATPLDNIRVVLNNRRRCYVDGVNIAAQASTGRILIVNADDQFACEGWDEALEGSVAVTQPGYPDAFYAVLARTSLVIEVSTGTPDEHDRGIMVMPILSRARYEQQGFVFYPEYESMLADNDFCETARKDDVVIDARHLMFPHRHGMFDGKGGWKREDWKKTLDAQYLAQMSSDAQRIGTAVYARRKASGFPPMQHGVLVNRRVIALCLSGESFQGVWVDALMNLYAHLVECGFSVLRIRAETSNVYVTREMIRRMVLNQDVRPDLLLWMDDDNPVSIAHFDKLLSDIDAHPEVDGISGWCWIHNERKEGFMPSCGEWAPDRLQWNPFHPSFANGAALRPFDCGGLPVMLMRTSAFDKLGDGCFLPIVDNRLEHGLTGEDMSFYAAAERGGAKFLVDPQVRVPHLKYVEVCPVFPEEGKIPVKVACMIRAKNEARWISRVIESVKGLCGDLIYVMEDGSTDGTRDAAIAAGAYIFDSPFVGQPFNEVRDKDWLLSEVTADCSPDWILMIDGDEELEKQGCEKIRRVLESNPAVDCFSLRVLYLWNSVDTARFDGCYEKMGRQSLFRANMGLTFKSYYEGEGANHCGLHCSNAPGVGAGMRLAGLGTILLHYGYLHREDRIRKYEWILKLDPHNEAEDFYRHSVQGDVPEVPADAKLKHAGPLVLQKLPARLVPKFEAVPGPFDPERRAEFAAAD